MDLAVRLVSVITNIKKERLVLGNLSTDQGNNVMGAIERLSRSRLHIVFGSGYTSSDVRAYVRGRQGYRAVLTKYRLAIVHASFSSCAPHRLLKAETRIPRLPGPSRRTPRTFGRPLVLWPVAGT